LLECELLGHEKGAFANADLLELPMRRRSAAATPADHFSIPNRSHIISRYPFGMAIASSPIFQSAQTVTVL
jgi:hypothetical protein